MPSEMGGAHSGSHSLPGTSCLNERLTASMQRRDGQDDRLKIPPHHANNRVAQELVTMA